MRKLLESSDYKGFKIEIKGEYTWSNWRGMEAVYVFAKVNNSKGKVLYDREDVYYIEPPMKFLFWTFKPKKTHKEKVEDMIQRNIRVCKQWIDNKLFEEEMTDGLLDSLDDLN